MQFRLAHLLIVVPLLGVLLWLVYPNPVLVADGRFALTLTMDKSREFDAPLSVAYCWNHAAAIHAEKFGEPAGEVPFRPVETTSVGVDFVSLPFSETHQSGRKASYHEPRFIVIQYSFNGVTNRKLFTVPKGRGDRPITISLE